jgi:hypothetical protein
MDDLATYEAKTLLKLGERQARVDIKVRLFITQTLKKRKLNAAQRVRIAGQFVLDKIKTNLSRPVRKIKRIGKSADGTRTTRTTVDPKSRSKPGEFPRADTTRLMKDIFHIHDANEANPSSKLGTTLKYGLLLEVTMDRSFLRRTLNEMRSQILLILKGGGDVGGVS